MRLSRLVVPAAVVVSLVQSTSASTKGCTTKDRLAKGALLVQTRGRGLYR